MYLGSLYILIISATICKSLEMKISKTKHSEVVRTEKKKSITQRSSYKTSEKIEKAPSEDHPCNLTRTTMRISFPALRSELFVNILGYREPNLVTLWQCKGFCGGGGSQVGCMYSCQDETEESQHDVQNQLLRKRLQGAHTQADS